MCKLWTLSRYFLRGIARCNTWSHMHGHSYIHRLAAISTMLKFAHRISIELHLHATVRSVDIKLTACCQVLSPTRKGQCFHQPSQDQHDRKKSRHDHTTQSKRLHSSQLQLQRLRPRYIESSRLSQNLLLCFVFRLYFIMI